MKDGEQALETRIAEVERHLRAMQTPARDIDELREWLGNLQREHADLLEAVRRVSRQSPTVSPLHGDGAAMLETFDVASLGAVTGFRHGAAEDLDSRLYVAFEDFFRGSEQTIRERQRAYVPLLEGRGPVLDVGCGRGELLELMRDMGVPARGIDVDPAMVERCREKGLGDVEEADAVVYLKSVDDGSLDVITALQVIEHLPYRGLLSFLRASRTKLRPGGRLIMETINPHSPQALKHFWIDPTHQHPLFSEIVVALCGLTGFHTAYAWYPGGVGDPDVDRAQQADYSVVAETGLADASHEAAAL